MKRADVLQSELKLYKEGKVHSNGGRDGDFTVSSTGILTDENRRLKAQNSVLQKKIAEITNESTSNDVSSSNSESSRKSDRETEIDGKADRSQHENGVDITQQASDFDAKSCDSYTIKFETEQEEKRLIQEQLHQLEISSNEKITQLQKQIEILKEKLDEKQNTCLQLQHDYEKRIQDINNEATNLKTIYEQQTETLKSDNTRLTDEVQINLKNKEDDIARYQKRVNDMQSHIDHLESQIGTVSAENNQQLRDYNAKHQKLLEDKELQLSQTIVDINSTKIQLEHSKEAYETLLKTVQHGEEQLTAKIQECEQMSKLAEQRKKTIEDLAMKLQQENEKYKFDHEKYELEIQRLENQIGELNIKDRTMKSLQAKCSDLELKVKSYDELKQLLSKRVEELENELIETKNNHEMELNEKYAEYQQAIIAKQHLFQESIDNLNEMLREKNETNSELNAQLDVLKQESLTHVEDKRAHERKGAALLKDLQKQLHTEKKKTERLQEKLTELLSGDKTALDELFYIPRTDGSRGGSVSSFNGGNTHAAERASITSVPIISSPLEQENNDLILKLAKVQEEKAVLEEKVRHLETSGSSMADDLVQKSAIIQHYSIEKRAVASSSNAFPSRLSRRHPSIERNNNNSGINLRNMFDTLVRDNIHSKQTSSSNDDTIKNLQRLLEETLTKNMHLQKDLEILSRTLESSQQKSDTSG
ncbi:unnamed protein product [Didymodactylos carnosus]|uniref:GRIP1-associated protein 1 n=1 Tax=Didymodactylos carnosus TaxID=1234261 RepID=A0A814A890_9BILA|nr:unnamed protein product [Didymodactylos carnosus]CAF3690418.1 unnamed protein product [Didymodactylos carnosus]